MFTPDRQLDPPEVSICANCGEELESDGRCIECYNAEREEFIKECYLNENF